VTAEALIYGAVNGLVLTALLFAFTVLNSAVPVGRLIQYVPRAFYPFAVVSAIAVSFFPTTLRQIRQVREAQMVRGYRMRGIKDWLPLFVPVLVGGLERALQLAEAMTSRGFAGGTDEQSSQDNWVTAASVTGLLFILGGVVMRLIPAWAPWSVLCLAIGVIAIVWAMWKAGRGVKWTRYYQSRWTYRDSLVVITALLAAVPALVMKNTVLDYSPYPAVSWPSFDLISGITLLGFVSPVWLTDKDIEVPG
jgi:energy-coupling factor transport system permease protein